MKKKFLALLLALALTAGLAIPALASVDAAHGTIATEMTLPSSLDAPVISDLTLISMGITGNDFIGYNEMFQPEVSVSYPAPFLEIVENVRAGNTYGGRKVGIAVIGQGSVPHPFSDDDWDLVMEQIYDGVGTEFYSGKLYVGVTNADNGRLLFANNTMFGEATKSMPFYTRIKLVVYGYDSYQFGQSGRPVWDKSDIILESPWSNVIGSDEPKEQLGPHPNLWYAKAYDEGYGLGGGLDNYSDHTITGRWGIVVAYEYEPGRFSLSQVYDVDYSIPAYESAKFTFRPDFAPFDDPNGTILGYFGDLFPRYQIDPAFRVIYVDLNDDQAYAAYSRFGTSCCRPSSLHEKYGYLDKLINCTINNYGAPIDRDEGIDWLYHYFSNELK